METLKTYNGWTNWHTWCVNTWLVNDAYCLSLCLMMKKMGHDLKDFKAVINGLAEIITDDINIELVNFTEIFDNLE